MAFVAARLKNSTLDSFTINTPRTGAVGKTEMSNSHIMRAWELGFVVCGGLHLTACFLTCKMVRVMPPGEWRRGKEGVLRLSTEDIRMLNLILS